MLLLWPSILFLSSSASALSLPLNVADPQQAPLRQPPAQFSRSNAEFEQWLENEERISVRRLLANVAPTGANAGDAAPGAVIASPSRGQYGQPDYFYHWVRDAAITSSTLVSLYLDDPTSDLSAKIANFLDASVGLTKHLQHQSNPTGSFEDSLKGLGEPKFNADGSPFPGSWGRPQRDGPALRAIALMEWLRAWNSTHPSLWLDGAQEARDWFDRLYISDMPADSAIKADLEYVSHFWRESGFDLWEETEGRHFFTAMVQLRAMREGARLATAFGDPGAAKWYRDQEAQLRGFMHLFWDDKSGHLVQTLAGDRSGLDCGVLLGALHGVGDQDESPYPPWSDEILATLYSLARDQGERFPINSAHGTQGRRRKSKIPTILRLSKWFSYFSSSARSSSPKAEDDADEDRDGFELRGVGIGRYPEDVYDGVGTGGGNPWFLCTCAAAETLYHTASHLSSTSSLYISNASLPFFRSILQEDSALRYQIQTGTYEVGVDSDSNAIFTATRDRLLAVADSFLDVVKTHTGSDGSLSEQFDGMTGFERGARDLTWSYGAFLDAVKARKTVLRQLGYEVEGQRSARSRWLGWKGEM